MGETISAIQEAAILIPSLEPDERLPVYIRSLAESGFGKIIVVDDGSGDTYQQIFREVESIDRTIVLHHEVNRGKGVALKTGYQYILDYVPEAAGIITADADGQHTVPDCIRLAEKLSEGERAVYLGSRDFSLPDIPPKSRSGNKITSTVFKLFYGVWLPDTQTGLRAFRREELPFMLNVSGEPTYFLALKDDAGLVKKYAMVNIQRYQIVAIGDTVAECERAYLELMKTNNITSADTSAVQKCAGFIEKIAEVVIDGNTHYYLILEGSDTIYDVNVAEFVSIVRYDVGERIKLQYLDGSDIKQVFRIEE